MVLSLVKCEDIECHEEVLCKWLLEWTSKNVKNSKDEKSIAKKMSIFIPFIHFGAMSPAYFTWKVIPFCTKHELIPKDILSIIQSFVILKGKLIYSKKEKKSQLLQESKLLESKVPFACHRRKLSTDTKRAFSHTRFSFPGKESIKSRTFDENEKKFLENYYASYAEKNGNGPLKGIEKRVWEEYIDFSIRDDALFCGIKV